ncbi:MAG: hypothetical protein ACE5GJ_10810 [Gemmatimonadota bacterium]
MAHVTVDRLQAGMVLERPALDRRGRLLIPAETELSERHIQSLQAWGLTHVEVHGDEPTGEGPPEATPEVLEAAEHTVRDRFGEARHQNVLLETLFTHAVAQEVRRILPETGQ